VDSDVPPDGSNRRIDRNERRAQPIGDAFAARELLLASPWATIKDIAERQNICRKRFACLVRVPDII
jgi:hypothetical protein